MWSSIKTEEENDLTRYRIRQNEKVLTFRDTIESLRNNNEFVYFFNDLLKSSSYEAYFWEVKSTNVERLNEEFEFVLINSPILSRINADNTAFSKFFNGNLYVTTFLNLSGDSILIVPVQVSDSIDYSHLAKFVRTAPNEQIIAFWKLVGEEYSKSVLDTRKWLSTSGLGVHWLHVRIDSTPKYYNYIPFKEIS